ncbi:MAG: ATP synthase F0 subunit A [Acidobacteria bacterium]|nr:MAG: ATP synthase F0 subunit A [Acidobacteriota bacterium]
MIGSLAPIAVSGAEAFDPGEVIIHHVANSDTWAFGTSKAVLMMGLAAVLVAVGMLRAARGYDGDGVPVTRWAQMIDPFVQHFYRDIAWQYVGPKWARRVTPLLLNFFFFILCCNLLGLVPLSEIAALVGHALTGHEPFFAHGAATATGNFNVTMSLAAITFFAIHLFGIRQQGVVKHFGHLLGPPGVPAFVRPLLFVIEVLSMFVKPFALTMRLAANMTAGHMALLALMSIPFILKKISAGVALASGFGAVVPLAVGISLLEIIVCFVQAYVFALLSGVFIGLAVHEQH